MNKAFELDKHREELSKRTVADIKLIAFQNGIEIGKGMVKAQLIDVVAFGLLKAEEKKDKPKRKLFGRQKRSILYRKTRR